MKGDRGCGSGLRWVSAAEGNEVGPACVGAHLRQQFAIRSVGASA